MPEWLLDIQAATFAMKRVIQDAACSYRRRAVSVVDSAAIANSRIARTDPANSAVLDNEGTRIVDGAANGGRVGADIAVLHRRRAVRL